MGLQRYLEERGILIILTAIILVVLGLEVLFPADSSISAADTPLPAATERTTPTPTAVTPAPTETPAPTSTPSPTPTASATPTPSPTPAIEAVVVSPVGLNLRAGPGTNYEVAGYLEKGQRLTVLEWNSDRSWIRVVPVESNKTGWVSAAPEYVQINPE